jgi:hypothetical protein
MMNLRPTLLSLLLVVLYDVSPAEAVSMFLQRLGLKKAPLLAH